jgi:hypothetical protein
VSIARTALTMLLLLSGGAALAGQPIEATLVVPDARLLPGVPFDFWVELHNPSETTRHIRVCEPFQLRLVAGEPVQWTETPEKAPRRNEFYWSHGGEAIVGPRETKVLAIPAASALMSGDFFRERLFSAAGRRFGITLPLCEQAIPSTVRNARPTLTTTEVEIEIMSPAGSDAEVWSVMEKAGRGEWTAADMSSPDHRPMWESVLRDFPDSNYVPYAVLMTARFRYHDWRDVLAQQLRTIERFSDSPVVEWLHVEAWQMARTLELRGVMLAEGAIVRESKRPTTRLLAYGNDRR